MDKRVLLDMSDPKNIKTIFSGTWCGRDLLAAQSHLRKGYERRRSLIRKERLLQQTKSGEV